MLKRPQDLTDHNCINLRLPACGGIYPWELEKSVRELHVRLHGQVLLNGTPQMVHAALDGLGPACVPEDLVEPHMASGRLKRLLEDWCPPFAGYHLNTPAAVSRRGPLRCW